MLGFDVFFQVVELGVFLVTLVACILEFDLS